MVPTAALSAAIGCGGLSGTDAMIMGLSSMGVTFVGPMRTPRLLHDQTLRLCRATWTSPSRRKCMMPLIQASGWDDYMGDSRGDGEGRGDWGRRGDRESRRDGRSSGGGRGRGRGSGSSGAERRGNYQDGYGYEEGGYQQRRNYQGARGGRSDNNYGEGGGQKRGEFKGGRQYEERRGGSYQEARSYQDRQGYQGQRGGRSKPSYNSDDFEVVSEGDGDDGRWDDYDDFTDEGTTVDDTEHSGGFQERRSYQAKRGMQDKPGERSGTSKSSFKTNDFEVLDEGGDNDGSWDIYDNDSPDQFVSDTNSDDNADEGWSRETGRHLSEFTPPKVRGNRKRQSVQDAYNDEPEFEDWGNNGVRKGRRGKNDISRNDESFFGDYFNAPNHGGPGRGREASLDQTAERGRGRSR
ncbi:unnamed protein product, partial [Choristocarpus tenellus]